MDEKLPNDLITYINRLGRQKLFRSLESLTNIANEVASHIHKNLFYSQPPFLSSTKLTNDNDCRYDFETKQIDFAKKIYRSNNVGEILFATIHESIHHVQNTIIEQLWTSQNINIRALAANITNAQIQTDNGSLQFHNYFDPPSKADYGGFIATGELCYKLQPMERQARFLTFEIMHAILREPSINPDVKKQMRQTLREHANESPARLRRSARRVRPNINLQKEINKILLKPFGEKQFIDNGVVETFLKSQQRYLTGCELAGLRRKLTENTNLEPRYLEEWGTIEENGDIQCARNFEHQSLSDWEIKVLNTLISNKDWDKELEDWERNER